MTDHAAAMEERSAAGDAADSVAARPQRRPIRPLSALVANQIAAGEVIERPASVVKELVDNALDAGATRIVVELERGGIELVSVTDDGVGLPAEELPLALAPHATSKIITAADLDSIATMGFRGEALASIASVSRLCLRSRPADAEAAAELRCEGDALSEVAPAAGPPGTRIVVRNLFFNTPARRKFLRTETTERGHCLEIVRQLALAHPAVGFAVTADGKTLLDAAATASPRKRALDILGAEFDEQYLEASADHLDDARGLTLWGLIGRPTLARPTLKHQRVFLNGRPIRDKTITHALREAFRGLIEPGRHPAALVMLEMSPAAVDVNVHPAKAEVRFRDPSLVHRVVYRAAKAALTRADITPEIGLGAGASANAGATLPEVKPRAANDARAGGGPNGDLAPESGSAPNAASGSRFVEFFRRLEDQAATVDGQGKKLFDFATIREAVEAERREIDAERARLEAERAALRSGTSAHADEPAAAERKPTGGDAGSAADAYASEHLRATRHRDIEGQSALPAAPAADRSILQVHNSFLVTQDEQGLVIIDQHALHERVMFEKLKARIADRGSLEAQALLTPATARVEPSRLDRLEELTQLLEALGIEARALGPETLGVSAFPTLLLDKHVEPAAFVAELLEKADDDGLPASPEEALHEVLDMMACKAAVKAGDRLSEPELAELLRYRRDVERAAACPHGRPTTVRLTIAELEKHFHRG